MTYNALITTNDFNDGSLILKYAGNDIAAESFSVSCQATKKKKPVPDFKVNPVT